jgi:hypothetical protein
MNLKTNIKLMFYLLVFGFMIIGASPDEIATINNKKYCIEIKCPFKYRN